MEENIQDAESTIRDTDVADEMMAYTKNNILIQSAQAMLAQANQVPQGVLQLLQLLPVPQHAGKCHAARHGQGDDQQQTRDKPRHQPPVQRCVFFSFHPAASFPPVPV